MPFSLAYLVLTLCLIYLASKKDKKKINYRNN